MRRADERPARRRLAVLAGWALLAGALVLLAPRLLEGLGVESISPPWGPACVVTGEFGETGLTAEDARLATTAVALASRGAEAPETSGIDPDVMRRLAEGPAGDAGPSLTCRVTVADGLERQEPTDSGLTPRAAELRDAMAAVFGEQSLGGFAPGGVDSGHMEDSAHYDGRAIDIFYRPVSEENRREGWLLAHWLVAHAAELGVQHVIFDDRVWSVHASRRGWQDYASPDPDDEILRHLDHVHVDVLRSTPADSRGPDQTRATAQQDDATERARGRHSVGSLGVQPFASRESRAARRTRFTRRVRHSKTHTSPPGPAGALFTPRRRPPPAALG